MLFISIFMLDLYNIKYYYHEKNKNTFNNLHFNNVSYLEIYCT